MLQKNITFRLVVFAHKDYALQHYPPIRTTVQRLPTEFSIRKMSPTLCQIKDCNCILVDWLQHEIKGEEE
jgi:hypothetical protein